MAEQDIALLSGDRYGIYIVEVCVGKDELVCGRGISPTTEGVGYPVLIFVKGEDHEKSNLCGFNDALNGGYEHGGNADPE